MNCTDSLINANARIELEHIQLELRNGRAQHFRSFIDQYYCYVHGHVNKTGSAHWESIVWTGSVSRHARSLGDRKLVVKEHVVPLRVIREMLIALSIDGAVTLEGIASVLDANVRFATISKEEDKALRQHGLSSKMPEHFYMAGHELCGDLFARYKAAGIVME